MKLSELTDLYVKAKAQLEEERGPPKKQKAVEGITLGQELVRDAGIISFMMGAIFLLISVVPPPLHPAADLASPPKFVKPDWYLLWSLGPIFVAKWPIPNPLPWGPDPLIDQAFLGTILVQVPFIAVMLAPFFARGKARRPVESPLAWAMGWFGLAVIWWLSILGIADIIYAFEVQPLKGTFHWLFEAKMLPDPAPLIDWLGILSLQQSLAVGWLAYWFMKRHRPRYETKLNATYFKVR